MSRVKRDTLHRENISVVSMATTKRREKDEEKKSAPPERGDSTLDEQLDRAEVAVKRAKDATAYLHQQWREHMFRLSLLVLIISFYMCRLPMSECMTNIKVRKYYFLLYVRFYI